MEKKIKVKKISKQVRVEDSWHKQLKVFAAENGMTVTRVVSLVCKDYFGEPVTKV